ncbi:hypothetical protein RJT34_24279 [Clitoria ternatea]|uniref:Uncharacterized protein n=1 Tax=Clitoria ternatea TaxID=43366 RepID=A0AAN9IFR2_CLITE
MVPTPTPFKLFLEEDSLENIESWSSSVSLSLLLIVVVRVVDHFSLAILIIEVCLSISSSSWRERVSLQFLLLPGVSLQFLLLLLSPRRDNNEDDDKAEEISGKHRDEDAVKTEKEVKPRGNRKLNWNLILNLNQRNLEVVNQIQTIREEEEDRRRIRSIRKRKRNKKRRYNDSDESDDSDSTGRKRKKRSSSSRSRSRRSGRKTKTRSETESEGSSSEEENGSDLGDAKSNPIVDDDVKKIEINAEALKLKELFESQKKPALAKNHFLFV